MAGLTGPLTLQASADEVIEWRAFLLQCECPLLMLWTAPPPGTWVPWMWVLLRPPRFGGAKHASSHDSRSRHRKVGFSNPIHENSGGALGITGWVILHLGTISPTPDWCQDSLRV